MKKHIPNFFTFLNLFSGLVAVVMALSDRLEYAAYFVFLGVFFDFFDGFFARMFQVEGELGKQLDSLADMVTSGVVPGMVMFQLLHFSIYEEWFMTYQSSVENFQSYGTGDLNFLPYLAFLIPIGAARRLANFNIDERQSDSFIGMPTPALSILVVSIPLILTFADAKVSSFFLNSWVLVFITVFGTYILNAELPMFSLKFKNYQWQGNQVKYVFLALCVLLFVLLKVAAIPAIIMLYVIVSVIDNLINKKRLPS